MEQVCLFGISFLFFLKDQNGSFLLLVVFRFLLAALGQLDLLGLLFVFALACFLFLFLGLLDLLLLLLLFLLFRALLLGVFATLSLCLCFLFFPSSSVFFLPSSLVFSAFSSLLLSAVFCFLPELAIEAAGLFKTWALASAFAFAFPVFFPGSPSSPVSFARSSPLPLLAGLPLPPLSLGHPAL